MLHVWYINIKIYSWANIGKYSIHGAYGFPDASLNIIYDNRNGLVGIIGWFHNS